jgi:hypothetical protein
MNTPVDEHSEPMVAPPARDTKRRDRRVARALLAVLVVGWTAIVVVRSDHLGSGVGVLSAPRAIEFESLRFNSGGWVDVVREVPNDSGSAGRALAVVMGARYGVEQWWGYNHGHEDAPGLFSLGKSVTALGFRYGESEEEAAPTLTLLATRSPHHGHVDDEPFRWSAHSVCVCDEESCWRVMSGTPEIEELFRVLDDSDLFEIERRHQVWQRVTPLIANASAAPAVGEAR